jgi:transposase
VVYIIDECHLLWGDVCGYVWGPRNERVEIPISNERERQTYYGALNYGTKEFCVKAYSKGDGTNTVSFIQYLQAKHPKQRLGIIWDGATYHTQGETKTYLTTINENLPPEAWPITCLLLAPHAPDQSPVEDIWLKAKNWIRENHHLATSFTMVKHLFVEAVHLKVFDFPKVYAFG